VAGPDGQSCLGEQPDQSLVAAVAQRWSLAGGEERAELLRRQDRHDLAVELRRLQPGERVGVQLALPRQPGGEAAQSELSDSGGGSLLPVVQQLRNEGSDSGPVERGRPGLPVASGEEGADSGCVQPDGALGLALGAQVDGPALQQRAQVGIGHADVMTDSAALHQAGRRHQRCRNSEGVSCCRTLPCYSR
jgi:hypothetical protein